MERVKWSTFKSFVDTRGLKIQYFDHMDRYHIYAYDGPFYMWTRLRSDDSSNSDTSDFETNYKDSANEQMGDSDGIQLTRSRAFSNSDGFRFRGKGITGTATKNDSSNIDYKLTEERYINGVNLILKDHVWGDSVKFQVVDKDGVYYPAGTVLDEFGTDWYVDPAICAQGQIIIPYPAKVIANLYLRIVYSSVGTVNNVSLKANLFLHKKGT